MSGPTVEKEVTAVTILVTKQDEKNLTRSLKFFLEKHEQNADMYVKVARYVKDPNNSSCYVQQHETYTSNFSDGVNIKHAIPSHENSQDLLPK